jgi:phosphoribosylformimino-5-aminoimidazole carboxamide ribotide isomerase
MHIIPVIDLMAGVVVHAVGGRRHEYLPLVSRLCDTSAPLEVARAFRRHFSLTDLYLADLDAIAGRPFAVGTWTKMLDDGFSLWVDPGVHDPGDAKIVAATGAGIVVGLETLNGPKALAEIVVEFGDRVMLSLDLREGKPLGRCDGWQRPDAWGIAGEAIALGVQRLLILDLACVGGGAGTATEELCSELTSAYSQIEVLAGGGVGNRADLLRLKGCGVSAVLAASALHDGRLSRADLEGL